MSFDYTIIPTCGNLFQTNQPEHELDDYTGNRVTSVYVTNEKDMAHTSAANLINTCHCIEFSKTEITHKTGILVLVRYDFQNLLALLV